VQQLFEIALKTRLTQQPSPLLHIDQHVEVAI
jgi:hypothetical protein